MGEREVGLRHADRQACRAPCASSAARAPPWPRARDADARWRRRRVAIASIFAASGSSSAIQRLGLRRVMRGLDDGLRERRCRRRRRTRSRRGDLGGEGASLERDRAQRVQLPTVVGGETVDGDDGVQAEPAHDREVRGEVVGAALELREPPFTSPPWCLSARHGRDDDDRARRDPAVAAGRCRGTSRSPCRRRSRSRSRRSRPGCSPSRVAERASCCRGRCSRRARSGRAPACPRPSARGSASSASRSSAVIEPARRAPPRSRARRRASLPTTMRSEPPPQVGDAARDGHDRHHLARRR